MAEYEARSLVEGLIMGRDVVGQVLADQELTVTTCCGRLLPADQTLVGDQHFPDLCLECIDPQGNRHEQHVTCKDASQCPGREWVYDPVAKQPSFTCPKCGMTSYNPNDIREGYCGNCHTWTGLGYS